MATGYNAADATTSKQKMEVTSKHPYLTIEVTSASDAHTIVLSGEVDLLGTPQIEAALKDAYDANPELIVIDLKNLTFIDSSGLHALVTGHELCRARGQELRIIPGPANVQRLFELTGMNEVLPFYDSKLDRDSPSDDASSPT
jgi:anti-sigma B factor antagonist